MNNELEKRPESSVFSTPKSFEEAQRVAKMLSESTLVPKEYQKNVSNTMIALEMANRTGSSPIMVMQNMNVIHGKPSWSSSFIIAALNSCGRFERIKFVYFGTEGTQGWGCFATSKDKSDGSDMKGPKITMKMAIDEGWVNKAGSKWKTMPELMLSYRAAAFFGRLHAPDILQGMHSVEENVDIKNHEVPNAVQEMNEEIPDAVVVDEENEEMI